MKHNKGQKLAVTKKYGMSCIEIAKVMDIEPGKVRIILSQAMRKLRRNAYKNKELLDFCC